MADIARPRGRPPKEQPSPAQGAPAPDTAADTETQTAQDTTQSVQQATPPSSQPTSPAAPQAQAESDREKLIKAEQERVQKFYAETMVRIPPQTISGRVEVVRGKGITFIVLSNKLGQWTHQLQLIDADKDEFKQAMARI